jgi:hypothetical protein
VRAAADALVHVVLIERGRDATDDGGGLVTSTVFGPGGGRYPAVSTSAAKVDPAGNLRVKQLLAAQFSRSVEASNDYGTAAQTTLLQTTATLAIGRIALSVEDAGTSPWDGAI